MHDHMTGILLGLFVVYVASQVGAELAQRLKMPAVVGEIAMGCLVGPGVLGWVRPNEPLEVLAEIGAVLLLFSVGLETRLGDLQKVGKTASLVAVAGVILPFVVGFFWATTVGFATLKSLFVAAAFVATSAGITARVLHDVGALSRLESRVILGAAVIDDILAMLLLGVVTALQKGNVDFGQLVIVLVQAVGFVLLVGLVGTNLMRRRSSLLDVPINPLSPLTLSLAGCLGLAALASQLGLAAIIGAFLAGMVAAESKQRHALERQIQPLMAFLVPFFFVLTGTQIQLSALAGGPQLLSLLVIVVLAVFGKLVGCGLGAYRLGLGSAAIVGIGMVPRGEVGIIIASLGLKSGVFNETSYALIIAMSLLTSVIAPPILIYLLNRTPPSPQDASIPRDEEDVSHLLTVDETGYSQGAQKTL